MSLKKKSAIAFAWDIGGTFSTAISGFVISIILARLLTPEQFGLVGMAIVFIAISKVFIDVGFASALIQSKDNTNLSYSSVFWLNVFIGAILTSLFFFIAPWVANFYGKPEITNLVRWLSLIFIFESFSIVQTVILKKELNFKILTIRTTVAAILGGIAGISCAFLGFGVYSLVIQNLVAISVGTVLLWTTTSWRPDFQFSFREVKKLIGFSSYVFFDRFLSELFRKLDILVVGKVFSASALGFYTRAVTLKNQVTNYSSSSLSKVFFPVLSSLQDNHKEFKRVYFKVVSVVAFLSFGLTGILYILGEDVIITLFGEKWRPSVKIFQIIILGACTYPVNSMMVNAFMSKGKSKENFYTGLFRKFIRLIPFYIAYKFGLYEFTIALVFVSYFLTIVNIFLLKRYSDLSAKIHFIKIFEGAIPLMVFLIFFEYFAPSSLFIRVIMVFLFIGGYLFYSKLINSEGFIFILSNYPKIKNKLRKRIKK